MVIPALIALALAEPSQQTIVLNVSFGGLSPEEVGAVVQQDGRSLPLRLVDDGTDPFDARGDRVYTGSITGDPAQYLGVAIHVRSNNQTQDVYNGQLRVGMERHVELAFEVSTGPSGALQGVRRASASPGRMSHATEAIPLMAATFWAVLVLIVAALLQREKA